MTSLLTSPGLIRSSLDLQWLGAKIILLQTKKATFIAAKNDEILIKEF